MPTITKKIGNLDVGLTYTVDTSGVKPKVTVDSFTAGALQFVPLNTTDDPTFYTHQALADLFTADKNSNATVYAGGGHNDRPDRNAAKIKLWGGRDADGNAMKCFIVYDLEGATPTPIAMVNLGTSLISYNGHLIHEGGILLQAGAEAKHVDAIKGAVKGYYHEITTTTPPLLDSAGWLYTVAPTNTSVVSAFDAAGISHPDTNILEVLLEGANVNGEHRFTTSDTRALLEGGVEKVAYFYDPHAAMVQLTGAVDAVDVEQ